MLKRGGTEGDERVGGLTRVGLGCSLPRRCSTKEVELGLLHRFPVLVLDDVAAFDVPPSSEPSCILLFFDDDIDC